MYSAIMLFSRWISILGTYSHHGYKNDGTRKTSKSELYNLI